MRRTTTRTPDPVPVPTPPGVPIAFSYLRFSSPKQADGDSVRRQDGLRDAWLARTGAVLDTSLSLRDEGVSAFSGKHRQNPDRHALAAFLELVRRGRVPRGSYLLVENLDRLSREHIRPALTLLLNLIEAGIRIVQLAPAEVIYDDKAEPMTLMMAIMELSRGHSESAMKSERVGGAWREKKRAAAETKEPMTRRVPAWLRVQGGGFVVDEAKAAVVRRIFRMATEGFGIGALTSRFNVERVPPIGGTRRSKYWARSYVAKLLANRAVLGECQPHTRRGGPRRADGAPIADYFPPIISEEEFHAARAALLSRRVNGGGRPARRLNLFAGLLRDARDGGALHQVNKGKKGVGPVLVNYKGMLRVAGAKCVSFPLEVFERSVLSKLREIDPREILPQGDGAADRVQALTGQHAEIAGRIEQVKAQLIEGGEVASLVAVVRALEEKLAAVAAEREQAKREAASPLSEAWEEYGTLVEALDAAPDPEDARVRLRAVLGRMVEGVWCLFVARGAWRLAAVQVWFAGGAHRDYLVLHKAATGGAVGSRPARTLVRSFAAAGCKGELDLRNSEHVSQLEASLATVPLD